MKKNIYIITLLISLFVAEHTFAQVKSDKALENSTVAKAKERAQSDLSKNTASLFIQGGIASTITAADRSFKKKYLVDIRDFGCIGMNLAISTAYNQEVFKYLDSKFGKQWRTDVRQDIIGLKEYLTK